MFNRKFIGCVLVLYALVWLKDYVYVQHYPFNQLLAQVEMMPPYTVSGPGIQWAQWDEYEFKVLDWFLIDSEKNTPMLIDYLVNEELEDFQIRTIDAILWLSTTQRAQEDLNPLGTRDRTTSETIIDKTRLAWKTWKDEGMPMTKDKNGQPFPDLQGYPKLSEVWISGYVEEPCDEE